MNAIDEREEVEALGYKPVRLLPTGEWAGIQNLLFTVGLFVGIDPVLYRTRFCFPDRTSAESALRNWDGVGDPPGPWIKEKGRVERVNPRHDGGAR